MSTFFVGLSAGFECASKIQGPQFLNDVRHVIVKITTYDYRSIGVLFDNVPHYLRHSYCSVLQVLLFSRLEIAVENLNVIKSEL